MTNVHCRFPAWAAVVTLVFSGACQPESENRIPLHGLETIEEGLGQAPVEMWVFKTEGPERLTVGASWSLRVEAQDPQWQPLIYKWAATSGELSQAFGEQVIWTATEAVGRAEVVVEAIDTQKNLLRGAFGVSVRMRGVGQVPGIVEDVRDDVGYHCSLAFSGSNPVIAYYNQTHPSLRFAEWNGSQWNIVTVEGYGLDIGGAAGKNASLSVDSSGTPHIAYITDYSDDLDVTLNYATRSGGQWVITRVDDASPRGAFNASLAINPTSSKPEILYLADDVTIKHAVCSGDCTVPSNWTSQVAYRETRTQDDEQYAYPGGFDIGANGTRHASYTGEFEDAAQDDYRDVWYMSTATGSWGGNERLVPTMTVGSWGDYDSTRLTLDRQERPLVLHETGVFHRMGSNDWSLSEVEYGAMENPRVDILCDRDRTPPNTGVVYLTSYHSSALELVHTNSRSYFEYTYIGSGSSSTGSRTSLAVDPAGQAHLCWVDSGNLMYQ